MLFILLSKDLKLEFRTKEIVPSMFIFGLTVILIFALSFPNKIDLAPEFISGSLWVVILFTSVFGLNRAFSVEKEWNAMWSWISAPIDRGLIYFSKMISIIIYVMLAELLFLIPFFIFFKISLMISFFHLILIMLLGTASIISVGCLISVITLHTNIREILIPILLFPMVSPAVIASTKSTSCIFENKPLIDFIFWILILLTFFTIFSIFGYLIFNKIIEE